MRTARRARGPRPLGPVPPPDRRPASRLPQSGVHQGAPFRVSTLCARGLADIAGMCSQKYEPHHDFFHDQVCASRAFHPRHPRARICTQSAPLQAPKLRTPLCVTRVGVGAAGQRQAGERRAAHRHRPHVPVRRPLSRPLSQRAAACQACARLVSAARGLSRGCVGRRTTPEEGGETVFPQAATRVSGAEWSECAAKGLAVKTRRGDALLFYRCAPALLRGAPAVTARVAARAGSPCARLSVPSAGGLLKAAGVASLVCQRGCAARLRSLTPSGEVDHSSLHGSCPTTRGEKWSATKWCVRAPALPALAAPLHCLRLPRLPSRCSARALSCACCAGSMLARSAATRRPPRPSGARTARSAVLLMLVGVSATGMRLPAVQSLLRCTKLAAVVSIRASRRVCKAAF